MSVYNVGDKVRVKVDTSIWGSPLDVGKPYYVARVGLEMLTISIKPGLRDYAIYAKDVEPWVDSSTTPSVIIVHNGKRYKQVEREAQIGDLVVATKDDWAYEFKVGDVMNVVDQHGRPAFVDKRGDKRDIWSHVSVLEPLIDVQTPLTSVTLTGSNVEERIKLLEDRLRVFQTQLRVAREDIGLVEDGVADEVATLKERVLALEGAAQAKGTTNVGTLTVRTDVNIADVAKKLAETLKCVKTPIAVASYTREQVVGMAKKDVETLFSVRFGKNVKYVNHAQGGHCRVKFVINRDKRSVVALLSMAYVSVEDAVDFRGIAHCAPDDCFNVHIGKAIALRRALGLDVPTYYTSAPKPTKVNVGDVVSWYSTLNNGVRVRQVERMNDESVWFTNGNWMPLQRLRVIDDSHDFGGEAR